ncbi:MAG: DUF6624 domain-containing protein [Saprospiraceae bacterium]
MRNWFLIMISLFFFQNNSFAQQDQINNDSTYQYWADQGFDALLEKKYTLCVECYDKAEMFKSPNVEARYFEGLCHDFNSKKKEAQKNLIQAVQLDWEIAKGLLDVRKEDYVNLKKKKRCWKKINKEFKIQQEEIDKDLRVEILRLDKEYNDLRAEEDRSTPTGLNKALASEKIFVESLDKIIKEKGVPTIKNVGRQMSNRFLYFLNEITRLKEKEIYFPLVKEAYEKKEIELKQYVIMIDKIEIQKRRPQIYGTQMNNDQKTGKLVFDPIVNGGNVNKRRAYIGLPTIESYAEQFGFEYKYERQRLKKSDFKKFTGGWDLVNIRDSETFEITFLPEQKLWVEFLEKGRMRFNRTANICETKYQATDRGRLVFTPNLNCTKKCCDDQKISQVLNYHDVIKFELYDNLLFLIDTKGKLWEFKRKRYEKRRILKEDN